MSIYNIHGVELSSAYGKASEDLDEAFDLVGTSVFLRDGDYNRYDNEYQHSILIARNEWTDEYRADSTVLPLILHTDQHGALSTSFAVDLFRYLGLAVRWDECATCINLGDVTDSYNETKMDEAKVCLTPIPSEKQINIWGNHETWGDMWPNIDWATLQAYYDNSDFYGYRFGEGTKCNQSMVDRARGIKFVITGGWDYDPEKGSYSRYDMTSETVADLISMLSEDDGYDIVFLSHIQPYAPADQVQADGTTTWFKPAVDGRSASSTTDTIGGIVTWQERFMAVLLNGRKMKTSGSITDGKGIVHSYDFTGCNSDLLCCFAGHTHTDLYNWQGGSARDLPVIVLDALFYDNKPFYFVNVNRAAQKINLWKVDNTAAIYRYSVDFTQPQST